MTLEKLNAILSAVNHLKCHFEAWLASQRPELL